MAVINYELFIILYCGIFKAYGGTNRRKGNRSSKPLNYIKHPDVRGNFE